MLVVLRRPAGLHGGRRPGIPRSIKNTRDPLNPAVGVCNLPGVEERDAPMTSRELARESLEYWAMWIDELEDHALDFVEYESMLAVRSGLTEYLVVAGDDRLFVEVDALDARFDELTIAVSDSPFAPGSGQGLFPDHIRTGRWWAHLPRDPEHRAYLFR